MITFAYGGTTIYLQNPILGNVIRTRRAQASGRSVGGDRYVYDQGVAWQEMDLAWEELRESERTDLSDFFDLVSGQLLPWTLTDHEGTVWTARFNQPQIEFTVKADSTASKTTFTSGGNSYPTTTRQHAVYACRVQLEVTAT